MAHVRFLNNTDESYTANDLLGAQVVLEKLEAFLEKAYTAELVVDQSSFELILKGENGSFSIHAVSRGLPGLSTTSPLLTHSPLTYTELLAHLEKKVVE